MAGGPPSGAARGEESGETRGEQAPWVDHNFLHGEEDVMGGDGRGDGLEERARHLQAEKNTKGGAEQTEEQRFGDDESGDGGTGEAEGAEKANFGTTADDVGGDGVRDKKHADDEGDEREGGKIELKST